MTQDDPLHAPLALPCGAVLPNRLAKAAMTEGLADARNRATEAHIRLYGRWAESGCGLLLTGNVQIDRRHLERAGNVAIAGPQDAEARGALSRFAHAAKASGAHVWMQLSHAGRQTPRLVNPEPEAPSAIGLRLPGGNFGKPKAMEDGRILEIIRRFGEAAAIARETGFTGVQVHAAHGYLISQFLSPLSNRRTDDWGGSIENRARILVETVKAVRAKSGADFPVSVKLNSADFQKGGFGHDDALSVVRMLNGLKIDLLEISGGNYEQPQMMGMGGALEPVHEQGVRASTRAREAYFLDYADSVSAVATMPLMVTGGFRTRAGMEDALLGGKVALIGLARPMCGAPKCPRDLLEKRIDALPRFEGTLRLGPGWLGPNSPFTMIKLINGFGSMGWYYEQLRRMGEGLEPDLKLGVFSAFRRYLAGESAKAKALLP